MLIRIPFVFCFLLVLNGLYAQINPVQIDSVVQQAMREWKIPGVAIGIVHKDSVVYAKGFGVSDLVSKKAVNKNTAFPIWSMGKSFTAFALALLEQQNKVHLDTPILRYGSDRFKQLWRNQPSLNAIDLLAHRTGLETFQGDFLWSASNLSAKQLAARWPKFHAVYPVRSGFHYNNLAYLMAGELIQQVSSLSWQQYLQQNIFSALGVSDITLYPKAVERLLNRASGYTVVADTVLPIIETTQPRIEPFGGMYADIGSMLDWLSVHINKGSLKGRQVFPAAIFDRVLRAQNSIGEMYLPDGTHPKTDYALGWELRNYHGVQVYSHGGAYAGFLSMMGFVPELHLGFVVFTNSDAHELGEALRWQIIDAAMGRPFVNYAVNIQQYLAAGAAAAEKEKRLINDTVAMHLPTSVPIKNFVGEYSNPVYGKVWIKQMGTSGLTMRFQHHPQLKASVYHLGANRFYTVYNQTVFGTAILPFTVAGDSVHSFKLFVNPSVEFKEYTFRKTKKTK
jgi:CubicO group peptidase (beta-lactamase class C family)